MNPLKSLEVLTINNAISIWGSVNEAIYNIKNSLYQISEWFIVPHIPDSERTVELGPCGLFAIISDHSFQE